MDIWGITPSKVVEMCAKWESRAAARTSQPSVRRPLPGQHNGRVIASPVETTETAPTILSLLGLNPSALDAVRIEHTPVLPGLR